MQRFATALLACVAATAALAQERPQDRWNLTDLYATSEAWNDDAARVERQITQFAACKGKLDESARRLKECTDLQYDTVKRYLRMLVYAFETHSEDTGVQASLERRLA